MNKIAPFLFIILIFLGCDTNGNEDDQSTSPSSFYKGMDLSFMEEQLDKGAVYKDEQGNNISNLPSYLSDQGVNLMRIRLWINNSDGKYNLNYVKRQALIAQQNNMDFLLCLHFSDTWADPGSQDTPAVWSSLNINELAAELENYCTIVLRELRDQNTLPQLVQIGNETNNGMLWPVGQVYTNGTENWDNYIQLTKAAINGVTSISPDSKIMIHHAGISTASYFYNQLESNNVVYDMVGLSYYPWWHGNDLNTMESDLRSFTMNQDKPVMIVETSYPFTLDWNDNTNNNIGLTNQLAPSYPATQNGQFQFLQRINQVVKNLPDDKGIGFCYWAPDWIAIDGASEGSSWENMALFDFIGAATSGLEVFQED
ncbi:glycoside hydrolase family 53 protein [Nonlabens sp.]|uniref:glycoside hydrolase family 53 protein n=1 Tax=Nonlabens sp. TaxID=1888209 RepID=UPI003F6A1D16